MTGHPCPFPNALLNVLDVLLPAEGIVLDPFAGIGRIHELATATRHTVGVEIEPEWAVLDHRTLHGDATALPFGAGAFDAVATSPAYGNRFADQCVRPTARTSSYAHSLGRLCSSGSGAALQWGPSYRDLHTRAIAEMVRVVKPGGLILVDIKDFQRRFEMVPVTEWWRTSLIEAGAPWRSTEYVASGGLRHVLHPNPNDEVLLVHEVSA